MEMFPKNSRIIVVIVFFLISCVGIKPTKDLRGSWYYFNRDKGSYREIHIDDSLFVYCYDNASIVVPFVYTIKDDSVYLMGNDREVVEKYRLLYSDSSGKKISLINNRESLVFLKWIL